MSRVPSVLRSQTSTLFSLSLPMSTATWVPSKESEGLDTTPGVAEDAEHFAGVVHPRRSAGGAGAGVVDESAVDGGGYGRPVGGSLIADNASDDCRTLRRRRPSQDRKAG